MNFNYQVERSDAPATALSLALPLECNTPDDVIYEHIKGALERKLPIIQPIPPHDKAAVIVGGGPSAKRDLGEISQMNNATIFALNGAGLWLQKSGIVPEAVIVLDARPHNAKFITGLDSRVHCYLATQCHPEVFAAAEHNGNPVITWHAANDEATGIAGIHESRYTVIIGAGTSVGMRALRLVHVLGYRTVHLFGYDSSYENGGDTSHSYPQPENEADRPRGCMVGGRWFTSTPWMIRQADDFQRLAVGLMVEGMHFHVHGDGLLPEVARQMNRPQPENAPYDPTLLIHETAQIHPFAHVGHDVKIGARTKVWQFASVIRGTILGEDCNVASCATLDGPHFGDRCIICQGVAMGPGFLFGNDCFVGPNVTVCNDAWPRADKTGFDIERLCKGEWAVVVKDGASIGANAVVLPGVTIGANAMVAAGSVVTRSIPNNHFWHRDGRVTMIDPERLPRRMRAAPQC